MIWEKQQIVLKRERERGQAGNEGAKASDIYVLALDALRLAKFSVE